MNNFVIAAACILLFIAFWLVAGFLEFKKIVMKEHSRPNKKKLTFQKILITTFVLIEKKIWKATGIKLPMWRRRLIRQAKYMQYLLNKEHGTNIQFPEQKPSKLEAFFTL